MKIAALTLLLMGLVSSCKLANLSTEAINTESVNREEKAIQLLEKTIKAHNFQALANAETYSYKVKDNWKGPMVLMNPFPKDNEWMEMRFRPATFDAQMQYLDTRNKDKVYGLQSLQYYLMDGDEEVEFKKKPKMEFSIAAVQYLFELPLRLINAPILKYAGKKMWEGVEYDLVFATWESIDPNDTYDQYLLYLHPETHELAFASYTVRAIYLPAPKGIYGSIRYENVQEGPEGFRYPATLYIQLNKLKGNKKWAHKMELKDLEFNSFDKSVLYPNAELPFIGDAKTSND